MTTFRVSSHRFGRPGEVVETPGNVEALAIVPSREEAERIRDLFPKSVGVRALSLGTREGTPRGIVEFRARLAADGVNGGVNETGIRRYRRFRKIAADLGYEIEWTRPALNSVETEDEFEAALLRGETR